MGLRDVVSQLTDEQLDEIASAFDCEAERVIAAVNLEAGNVRAALSELDRQRVRLHDIERLQEALDRLEVALLAHLVD